MISGGTIVPDPLTQLMTGQANFGFHASQASSAQKSKPVKVVSETPQSSSSLAPASVRSALGLAPAPLVMTAKKGAPSVSVKPKKSAVQSPLTATTYRYIFDKAQGKTYRQNTRTKEIEYAIETKPEEGAPATDSPIATFKDGHKEVINSIINEDLVLVLKGEPPKKSKPLAIPKKKAKAKTVTKKPAKKTPAFPESGFVCDEKTCKDGTIVKTKVLSDRYPLPAIVIKPPGGTFRQYCQCSHKQAGSIKKALDILNEIIGLVASGDVACTPLGMKAERNRRLLALGAPGHPEAPAASAGQEKEGLSEEEEEEEEEDSEVGSEEDFGDSEHSD